MQSDTSQRSQHSTQRPLQAVCILVISLLTTSCHLFQSSTSGTNHTPFQAHTTVQPDARSSYIVAIVEGLLRNSPGFTLQQLQQAVKSISQQDRKQILQLIAAKRDVWVTSSRNIVKIYDSLANIDLSSNCLTTLYEAVSHQDPEVRQAAADVLTEVT